MKKHLLMMAIASTCFIGVHASAMTSDEYKAGKDKIEADYKAAKAQCDTLKDNAKDVCENASHQRKVAEEKVKADYEVAKEKCDDMKGDAKNACVKEAKAMEAKGKADVKAMKM
ncbi:MAG: hypothetical protein DI563_20570 [Variovorax paradoxus]|uniref:Cell envelope biogenesis protein TolA n=1 Tax=Variovorax paradoxus TaxID=34073 RepID=A0A2W5PTN4_VARPD|nr:MAG: hypothetical protein DI563_20570 [Variovorax paradoxus]